MSNFQLLEDGERYRVINSFTWNIGGWQSAKVMISEGFTFNISAPKWLRRFRWIRCNEKWLLASCIHDRLINDGMDRMTAGSQFHNALRRSGVSKPVAVFLWLVVSLRKYGS